MDVEGNGCALVGNANLLFAYRTKETPLYSSVLYNIISMCSQEETSGPRTLANSATVRLTTSY